MDAIRVARGFTGREKIIKFEGGYHGHHDDVLISVQPPRDMIGDEESPNSVPLSPASRPAGSPRRSSPPSTSPRLVEGILEAHRGEIAAIIVEAVQFNIGVVPPEPGFLERLRELATEHGTVLIFDEVKTGVVIAYGGANEYFNVRPTSSAWPRASAADPDRCVRRTREVMLAIEGGARSRRRRSLIRPQRPHELTSTIASFRPGRPHGHHERLPAGRWPPASCPTEMLTPDVYPRLQAMGDRLTAGSQESSTSSACPAMRSTWARRGSSCSPPSG